MAGNAGAIKAGRAYVELGTNNSKLTAGLRAAEQRLRQFGATISAIGSSIVGMGARMAIPFGFALHRFMQFDDVMLTVKSVTNATAAEFADLTDTARRLGQTTSFTAVEVGSLMAELGRAGFAVKDIEEMTVAVMNLARATGTDATLSAGIMASTIRQYGLNAGQAASVSDQLTIAANASFTSVTGLGESLSYAGPVARDFNMSLTDTLAILGALGNVGIQGSNAGTALRRLLTITGADAAGVQRIFGVVTSDAAGNARPLVDIMHEISQSVQGLGTAARAAKFNELFGLLGITGASAIAGNIASVRELRSAIANSAGAAAAAAEEMDSGFGGSIRRIMGAAEGAAISLGTVLSPALRAVSYYLKNGVTAISEWISANGAAVTAIAATAVGVVAFGVGLVGVGLALKVTAFAISTLLLPMSMLLGTIALVTTAAGIMWAVLGGPVTLLVGGIALLTAGVVAFAASSSGALDTLSTGFSALAGIVSTTWAGVSAAMASGDWAGAMEIAWLGVRVAFHTGIAYLSSAWRQFSGFFVDVWDATTTNVGSVLFQAWAGIRNTFLTVVDYLAGIWDTFCGGMRIAFNEFVRAFRVGWAFVRNMFNSEARNQAIAQINAETDRANADIRNAVQQNEARRNREGQQREANDANVLRALEQDFQARMQARQREREARDRADQQFISGLQAELNARVGKAQLAGGSGAFNPFGDDQKALKKHVAAALARGAVTAGLSAGESKGTFSAFASGGLGADSVAKAVSQTATNTGRTADGIDRLNNRGPLAFGA